VLLLKKAEEGLTLVEDGVNSVPFVNRNTASNALCSALALRAGVDADAAALADFGRSSTEGDIGTRAASPEAAVRELPTVDEEVITVKGLCCIRTCVGKPWATGKGDATCGADISIAEDPTGAEDEFALKSAFSFEGLFGVFCGGEDAAPS
jgi:hypothetical protein